jgi:hypothetical protein
MMTSKAILPDGTELWGNNDNTFRSGMRLFYPPESISVYCQSGDCNYDMLVKDLPTPVPES